MMMKNVILKIRLKYFILGSIPDNKLLKHFRWNYCSGIRPTTTKNNCHVRCIMEPSRLRPQWIVKMCGCVSGRRGLSKQTCCAAFEAHKNQHPEVGEGTSMRSNTGNTCLPMCILVYLCCTESKFWEGLQYVIHCKIQFSNRFTDLCLDINQTILLDYHISYNKIWFLRFKSKITSFRIWTQVRD
jgi:hypothetical protein